ncbi:MAG: NAD-dependent epimerase [Saprospiraceae bacterium]
MENKGKVLVTGAAGFIGFHLIKKLLLNGYEVVGLDNINNYYMINLKYDRCNELGIPSSKISDKTIIQSQKEKDYKFIKADLKDYETMNKLFQSEKFDRVINLAGQVGVRYSLENPHAYIESNLVGFANILELCRHNNIGHLVFASSSSVYGLNGEIPFATTHNVDHPISLYAATKKSNELMAHSYSYLYNLPVTGLRFFTVYGPWGRPDMAAYLFIDAIAEGRPIKVFNNGEMTRDFTYVDDIVEGIFRVMEKPPKGNQDWKNTAPDPSSSIAPYKVYNIGENTPAKLMDFIETIEKELGKKAVKEFLPLQPGDMVDTYADIDALENDLGYRPKTTIEEGLRNMVAWYKEWKKDLNQ